MILIDTDHATYLKYPESERGRRFIGRLSAFPESEIVGVAIITVEERTARVAGRDCQGENGASVGGWLSGVGEVV